MMLEKAFSLCGATYGSLQVYDGERFRAVAVRGLPEVFGDLLREGFLPDPKHPQSGILRGERFVQIPDMAVVPGSEAAVKLGGMRTALGVPLRKDGALLGQISLRAPRCARFQRKRSCSWNTSLRRPSSLWRTRGWFAAAPVAHRKAAFRRGSAPSPVRR